MKLKITTAFPASKRFYLPLVGLFVLGATAVAQQMTIQPVAPPVESTTQLAMTNSFQLFNPNPPTSTPQPYEPFKWDQFVLRPHVDYQYTKAYHILAAPSNQVDTSIQRVSPGFLFNIGPHWAFDYTLGLGFYSATNFGTEVNHSLTLTGQTSYGSWDLGLLQSVLLTSSPLIEFGGQTEQNYYDTSVTGHHEDNQYFSEDLSLNQNVQVFPGGGFEDMWSWSTLNWLNYQPQSHISFGVGPGLGYNYAINGSDSVFFQLQGRVNWRLNDVFSLQLTAGFSLTEFLGPQGNGNIFSPIYSGTIQFRPFSQTALSVFASRYVSPSVLVNEYTEGTSVGASINQRLLGQFYFTAQAGYSDTKFVGTTLTLVQVGPNLFELELVNLGREDKLYSLTTRISHPIFERGSIAAFYQYSEDKSTAGGFSYASNQFGGEFSYSF